MSNAPFKFNPDDVNPGEPISQAKAAQKDAHDKKVAGEEMHNARIENINKGPASSIGILSPKLQSPVQFSKITLYIGIPLIVLGYFFWQEYLPYGDQTILGIPLYSVLFSTGILCIAFRFIAKIAAIGLILIGSLIGLGTITAMLAGEPLSSLKGNFLVAGLSIIFGIILVKVINSRSKS